MDYNDINTDIVILPNTFYIFYLIKSHTSSKHQRMDTQIQSELMVYSHNMDIHSAINKIYFL